MCTEKCSLVLYPLVLISVICNIILFFPCWDVKYVQNGQITKEVYLMGGLLGGGVLVLLPAVHFHRTGNEGCCAKPFGMFLAAVGVVGALYSFLVALLGLFHGLYCGYDIDWTSFLKKQGEGYLSHLWKDCSGADSKIVMKFNVVLFSVLLVANSLQIILCAKQFKGLLGWLWKIFTTSFKCSKYVKVYGGVP
ncbi:transmembrane 4 L6 family member 4-like isoform X1 [Paramisgurnus dabryanus]|uniref:transmembrane 4 L6 family member 4-like isoform X1 n=1 Tax=Paramisgurnus dabryanus TaxID=90735 RepID=UPI0031F41FB6